jgi:hypothetical protein
METIPSLKDLILNKVTQDVLSQVTQIAGSWTMIGAPIGFARKVGGGVKAFFYEPYLGAVHSSHDFVIGIGKGTSRLISGVVSGAMDSAVAIADTASKGISYLTGDEEYIRERSLIRQQNRSNQISLFTSINNGGEVIYTVVLIHSSLVQTHSLIERVFGRCFWVGRIDFEATGRGVKERVSWTFERHRTRPDRLCC